MAVFVLVIAAVAFGGYGSWRGAIRLCLALSPLIVATIFLRLLGPALFRIDSLRHAGLVWPLAILLFSGLMAGLILQAVVRKRLRKRIHAADRAGGVVLGVAISVVVVWLGCLCVAVQASARPQSSGHAPAARLARSLNDGLVGFIPGLGAGSNRLMDLMEIGTADKPIRRRVIKDLRLDRLGDLPEMQAVFEDESTQSDIQAAGTGSLAALWKLQSNPLVLELLETEEMVDLLTGQTLHDLAEAIRNVEASPRNSEP